MTKRTVLFPFSNTSVGGSNVLPSLLVKHFHQQSPLHQGPPWEVQVCMAWRGANAALFETETFRPDYLGLQPVEEHERNRWLERLRYYGLTWRVLAYRRILPYLRRLRPDLIHIHNVSDLYSWGFVGKLLKIPVVWHVHTHHAEPRSRTHFRLCDHMIFVAEASRKQFERLEGLPPHTTVHNAVDFERFHPPRDRRAAKARLGLSPERLTIGFVGNLVPRKRPEWAVQAALDLLKAGHDVQLVMVGEDRSKNGGYMRRLEDLVRNAGATDRVHFLGYRQDVPAVMQAMDVFLLSSEAQGEAFPLVVLEAMACRAAVVSTRSAGVPEAIADGETGLLADADDYQSFLAQVARSVSDDTLRESVACAGYRQAQQRFSVERCGKQVLEVYEKVLKGAGVPHA
jgi:glycosyltransferase involved in cell wall biosynthesis